MVILKYVREAKEKGLLSLALEGEESAHYTIDAATYVEIGSPESGSFIDTEMLSLIKSADQICRARRKALSLLAFADNNEKNLKMKLCRAGFDRKISDMVCTEMVELGYINEKRQLERLILSEANQKLRGPLRIIPALTAKGYSQSDIRAVMHDLMEAGEIDFRENAKRLIEKKLPDADAEEKRKLLYKNGYQL